MFSTEQYMSDINKKLGLEIPETFKKIDPDCLYIERIRRFRGKNPDLHRLRILILGAIKKETDSD